MVRNSVGRKHDSKHNSLQHELAKARRSFQLVGRRQSRVDGWKYFAKLVQEHVQGSAGAIGSEDFTVLRSSFLQENGQRSYNGGYPRTHLGRSSSRPRGRDLPPECEGGIEEGRQRRMRRLQTICRAPGDEALRLCQSPVAAGMHCASQAPGNGSAVGRQGRPTATFPAAVKRGGSGGACELPAGAPLQVRFEVHEGSRRLRLQCSQSRGHRVFKVLTSNTWP